MIAPSKRPAIAYQLKVTLTHSDPPIWRRLLVPDGTLDDLHEWVQTAMGWEDMHLHCFKIEGKQYGDPERLDDGFGDSDVIDSLEVELAQLFDRPRPVKTISYEYDFGDDWRHEIEFEGIQEAPHRKKPPCCLEGARACPPEDIGGVWGYAEFLQAINDPQHEEYETFSAWAVNFDPEAFSVGAATRAMRRGLRSY